ncbi:MAG: hypothetical protein KJ833_11675 [Alphaproteobacteria bacterium]|nr:hypothetical protein [Alphaproteobacteria bacterium]
MSGTSLDGIDVALVGSGIADSADWPTWYAGNEFEATRKASLGGP